LAIVSGQFNFYKNTLEITMHEIEKSVTRINDFLIDKNLDPFRIEVHGLKGSLSNIGSDLASKARSLEDASINGDIDFCISNLPAFVNELTSFGNDLKNAFEIIWNNQDPLVLPPALLPIFDRITHAMAETDFSTIYDEIDNLDALALEGALKEEVENMKGALMIMNYDYANAIIKRLVGGEGNLPP
jgi:HPt (histidine-containing phosphotransfer) domain-containing protein